MKKTRIYRAIIGGIFLLAAVPAGRAESPWLPEAGKLGVTTMYVWDTFTNYRPGALRGTLPVPYDQYTGYVFLEYGLSNRLALDVDSGYTATDFKGNSLSGIVDTSIGLRWQVKRGETYVLTLRGAGIVNGSYDITKLSNFSPGDKASGGMGSILYGQLLPHGFFTFTEMGYRIRQKPVPQDFFGSTGVGHSFKRLSYTASYQTSRSINGVDIVGAAPKFSPYFQPSQFPATKKIFGAMDYSANLRVRRDLTLGFDYSTVLHGRNVGMKRVLAFSMGFTLPGKLPHFR